MWSTGTRQARGSGNPSFNTHPPMYTMGYQVACDANFPDHEKYVDHVFKHHDKKPALRMKARILRDYPFRRSTKLTKP